MSKEQMNKDVEELGLTAPRITPEQIAEKLAGVVCWVTQIPDTTTTIAVAFDENGFSLATHITACADPDNFNAEFGEKYALEGVMEKAENELWKLEGYRLKMELANGR